MKRFLATEVTTAMNPFVYPYDLGWRENIKQVFFRTSTFGVPDKALDGITWPTIPGCNPYALTIEQKELKAEKMKSATRHVAIADYSGKLCAGGFGWSVRCALFCFTDEERLPLAVGETVKVTRTDGNWMYGWRDPPRDKRLQEKGWFPRDTLKKKNPSKKSV